MRSCSLAGISMCVILDQTLQNQKLSQTGLRMIRFGYEQAKYDQRDKPDATALLPGLGSTLNLEKTGKTANLIYHI